MSESADTGEGSTDQRLHLAKAKLSEMLDKVAQRNSGSEDIHVGVSFFGHRVAWEVDANRFRTGNKLIQEAFKNSPGVPNHPSDDVQQILPVGVFDTVINGKIKPHLDPETGLKPWGETPLYLALVSSLHDIRVEDKDRRKRIIAITDGINDTDAATTKDEVIKAAAASGAAVYILGFDLRPDPNLAGQARQKEQAKIDKAIVEFNDIARATKGEFVPIHSGTQLINKLEEQLDVDMYQVRETGRPPVKPKHPRPNRRFATLEKAYCYVSLNQQRSATRRAVKRSSSISLEAGRIKTSVAKAYEPAVKQANLLNNQWRKPIMSCVCIGRSSDKRNAFCHNFRSQSKRTLGAFHFTERPVETWVEITPLARNAQSYVFYDENFEPNTPVPVLNWTALNWPPEATEARIRFWCKFGSNTRRRRSRCATY